MGGLLVDPQQTSAGGRIRRTLAEFSESLRFCVGTKAARAVQSLRISCWLAGDTPLAGPSVAARNGPAGTGGPGGDCEHSTRAHEALRAGDRTGTSCRERV